MTKSLWSKNLVISLSELECQVSFSYQMCCPLSDDVVVVVVHFSPISTTLGTKHPLIGVGFLKKTFKGSIIEKSKNGGVVLKSSSQEPNSM